MTDTDPYTRHLGLREVQQAEMRAKLELHLMERRPMRRQAVVEEVEAGTHHFRACGDGHGGEPELNT